MFIGRNPDGTIYGSWTSPQPQDKAHPGVEEVPDTHPDYVAFRDRSETVIPDKLTVLSMRLDALEAVVDVKAASLETGAL